MIKSYVEINDFMDHLKQNGLCIGPASKFNAPAAAPVDHFRQMQMDLLNNNDALTPYKIVKAKLLPQYTTAHGLKRCKTFEDGETFIDNGKMMITTVAIKRMRKNKFL